MLDKTLRTMAYYPQGYMLLRLLNFLFLGFLKIIFQVAKKRGISRSRHTVNMATLSFFELFVGVTCVIAAILVGSHGAAFPAAPRAESTS